MRRQTKYEDLLEELYGWSHGDDAADGDPDEDLEDDSQSYSQSEIPVACCEARRVGDGAVLTGIESRSSSPVRVTRGETCESVSCQGLWVAGEGAGYAGGIMSAATDGIRVARALTATLDPGSR